MKTDRTDAESLVRVLMAIYRGEHQVAKIVQVPSPEEEDDKRLLRCRGNLLRDRIQHMNRIRGLLNLQGIRHIDPNRSNWENALVNLRTGGNEGQVGANHAGMVNPWRRFVTFCGEESAPLVGG